MDKLLTKVRHSLLIVSFLGITFSLTGASFTGQSAIASYLGIRFSDVNGFKWVYLIVLLYVVIRYVIYYNNEYKILMAKSIARCINRPIINCALKKILLDIDSHDESGFYTSLNMINETNNEEKSVISFSITKHDGDAAHYSQDIVFDFTRNSFKILCSAELSHNISHQPYGFSGESKYLNFYLSNGYSDNGESFDEYSGHVKRFSWIGVGIMTTGSLSFLFDSITRIKHFEYAIPLFTAICAFLMTLKYFFFSEKVLTILTTIPQGVI